MSKKFVKIGAVLFVLVLVLLVQNAKKAKPEFVAKAASLRAIPKYCLGGWENPTNAAGQPDVADGEVNGFTTENSAVLSQKSAQLFCGIFETDDTSFTPTRATLHLSWRVDFVQHEDADATAWQQTIASSTEFVNIATSTFASTTIIHTPPPIVVTPPSSEATTTESISTVVEPTPTSTTVSEPASTSTSTPTSTDVVPPPVIPQPTPTPAPTSSEPIPPPPPPVSSSTPPSTATTSVVLPWYQNVFALITPRVFAENAAPHATSDFLEITYTTDGKNWKSVGKVSESNWKNATVEIPVTSWDEVNKLQIALTPLFTADAPTIYLDGMWLEVHHDISLLGIVNTSVSVVTDATQSVADAVGNLLDSAINAVADVINPQPKVEEKNIVNNVSQAEAPEPPKTEFHFDVGGDIPVVTKIMPWARNNEQKEEKEGTMQRVPTVTPDPTHNAFNISGSCSKPYFAVLVFANQTDYRDDPSRAVINRSGACTGGSFSYSLTSGDFSKNLSDGTYYVIVGEQGMRESWTPLGAMYPIVITRITTSTKP